MRSLNFVLSSMLMKSFSFRGGLIIPIRTTEHPRSRLSFANQEKRFPAYRWKIYALNEHPCSLVKPWITTTTDSDFSKELHNILNEQFNPERPNAVCCTDITYIWITDGFVYLTSIMDLYSRKIIAWTLSEDMKVSCVIDTVNKAKARRNTDLPLILHSDRSSQYVSKTYREAAEKFNLSYSHKGYPYDNACIESFHSLIKREWLHRFRIADYNHAYKLVFKYIEAFYNTVRIHSHCDYMSPDQFEKLYATAVS